MGLYAISAAVLIIFSAVTIRLAVKHAEKPSLAVAVSLAYVIAEAVLLTLGAITLGFFN